MGYSWVIKYGREIQIHNHYLDMIAGYYHILGFDKYYNIVQAFVVYSCFEVTTKVYNQIRD